MAFSHSFRERVVFCPRSKEVLSLEDAREDARFPLMMEGDRSNEVLVDIM